MGSSTLIAAAQTSNATSTGIAFGGSNGAVFVDFHDNNINGFELNFVHNIQAVIRYISN
jgi:hypothetical protein